MSKLGKSEAEVVSDNSKKQDKFWEDGYGSLWKNIRTPDGIRRVRVQNDHEDVVLEQNEIFRERLTIESFFWLSVLIGFAINLLVIGGIVLGSVAPVSDRLTISPFFGGGGAKGKVPTPQGDLKINKFDPQFGVGLNYKFD